MHLVLVILATERNVMRECQKVVLYGNLLMLAGMKTSLAAYPYFDVITLDISPSLTVRDLYALQAPVILGDCSTRVPPSTLNEQLQRLTNEQCKFS
jgi:hypothetical protein